MNKLINFLFKPDMNLIDFVVLCYLVTNYNLFSSLSNLFINLIVILVLVIFNIIVSEFLKQKENLKLQ